MEIEIDPKLKKDLVNGEHSESVGILVGIYPEEGEGKKAKIIHLAQTKAEDEAAFPTIENVKGSLLSHHARQLIRMLPGGLTILGVYSISESQPTQQQIQQSLQNLSKSLQKLAIYSPNTQPQIFLHFDKKCKKFVCKNMYYQEIEILFKPLELLKIETEFDTSGIFVQMDVDKKVGDGIEELIKIWDSASSFILINGENPQKQEYKETEDISILVEKIPGLFAQKSEFLHHIHLQGKMHLLAYVNKGESCVQAKNALTMDLLRSLSSRLQMHKESLVDEESVPNVMSKVYHEIPRRVFVPLKLEKTCLLISDYLFPGEGPKDCVQSFKDIFGLVLQEDEIDEEKECISDQDSSITSSMSDLLERTSTIQPSYNKLFPLGLIFALFFALFSIYYYK